MSEHLPECGRDDECDEMWCKCLCTCGEIRALKQRAEGFAAGLDAAREAVAKECSTYPDLCGQCRANVYAIEALMEGTE